MKSEFLVESQSRGFIHQATDLESLDNYMSNKVVISYLGFDVTANSLHIGNLVQIMWLRLLQRMGHKPIILLGEGTTKIGDPSGKDSTRKILNDTVIRSNLDSIKSIIKKYITFGDGKNDGIFINNTEWFSDLKYIDLLKKFGSLFTINNMMNFESVKRRLNRNYPLTFLEFNYMILQSIDFLYLNSRFGCALQIAGSDQWGNITSGIDLIRKVNGNKVFGITSPLITLVSGDKMGKSVKNSVWLSDSKYSVFNFWQYWRNIDDSNVIPFLKIFTDLSLQEIEKLSFCKGEELNDVKKILADSVTRIIHGESACSEVSKSATSIFNNIGNSGLEGLPSFNLRSSIVTKGMPVIDVLQSSELSSSRSESRRLIRSGSIKIDSVKVIDENTLICSEHFIKKGFIVISLGKKRHVRLNLVT